MRLPRKWLLALAVSAAVPQAGWAQTAPETSPNTAQAAASEQAPQAPRPNKAIARDIATAMKSAGLTGRNIQIKVKDGQAVIGGEIGDAAQKATVSRLAAQVAGVQSVENNMVPMTAAPAAAPVAAAPQAQPVRTAAVEQAESTPRIEQVAHQQPNLLPTKPAKPLAAEPKQPQRTNQAVAQDIAKALSQAGLNKYDLEIRYKNGLCTLIGGVGSPQEAAQADYLCRNVDGVANVSNQLTVNGRPAITGRAAMPQAVPAGYPQGMPMAGPPQGFGPRGPVQPASAQLPPQMAQAMGPAMGAPMGAPAMGAPYGPGPQGATIQPVGHHGNPGVYNRPSLPDHAWPTYAPYDNYAAVTYPGQYDASAFPYIGPFYPYPQVPLGWRKAQLEWDDGYWNLDFDSRTDKWFWFLNPKNWD